LESEKFDLEKEILRLRRDNKSLEQQTSLMAEEKEHLISMLELKTHILSTSQGGD